MYERRSLVALKCLSFFLLHSNRFKLFMMPNYVDDNTGVALKIGWQSLLT